MTGIAPLHSRNVADGAALTTVQELLGPEATLMTGFVWNVIRWGHRFDRVANLRAADNWKEAVVTAGAFTAAADRFSWLKTSLQMVLIGKVLLEIIHEHQAMQRT